MRGRIVPVVVITVASTFFLNLEAAKAQVALNRAVVESIRNQVQVLQENRSPRSARVSDVLVPGNGMSTARQSFAELRFNDGSLGRLGEQVIFWFTPGSREFRLSNGTALLLIPPGQGRTRIRTPNATAGIQGSALFVRYIAETDTTVVGALTDSGIEMTNRDGSQVQPLRGGQMGVMVGDRIMGVYDFDLQTFYETSQLVQGLSPDAEPVLTESGEVDGAIAQVQEEMRSAIAQQDPLPRDGILETPEFLRLPTSTAQAPTPADLMDGFPQPEGSAPPENASDRGPQAPSLRPEHSLQAPLNRTTVDPRRDNPNPSPGQPNRNNDRPSNGRNNGGQPPTTNNGRPNNGGQPPATNNGRPNNGGQPPATNNGRPNNGGQPPTTNNGRPNNGGQPPATNNGRPNNGQPPTTNGRPNNSGQPPTTNNGRPNNGQPLTTNGRPNNSGQPANGNGRPGGAPNSNPNDTTTIPGP